MVQFAHLLILATGASAAVLGTRTSEADAAAGVALAPRAARTACTTANINKILGDLSTIDSAVKTFTTDVPKWDCTFGGSFTIQNDETNIDNDVKAATTDVNNINCAASSSQSMQVINYINNTLEPDIRSAISAIEGRNNCVQSSGLTSTVESDFQQLKTDTDALANALIASCSSDQVSAATAAKNKIDADLQGAINFF